MFNFVLEEVRDNNSPIAWEAVAYKALRYLPLTLSIP